MATKRIRKSGLVFPVGRFSEVRVRSANRSFAPPGSGYDGFGATYGTSDRIRSAIMPTIPTLAKAAGGTAGILGTRRLLNVGPMSDVLTRGFVTVGGSIIGLGTAENLTQKGNGDAFRVENIIEGSGLAAGLLIHDVILQLRRDVNKPTTRRRALLEQLGLMWITWTSAKVFNGIRES